MKKGILGFMMLGLLAVVGCGRQAPTPKPVAYVRFDFPKKDYRMMDTASLPFTFECAREANVVLKPSHNRSTWVDIEYPQYKGVVFLSYLPLKGRESLKAEVDTSYRLMSMHFSHSSGVSEKGYEDKEKSVYATVYRIDGLKVASTCQFWATDSVKHFLRGSLYLNNVPNNDSLAPILTYLQDDLTHLLETLEWRD